MMSITDFIKKYENKTVDFDGAYGGQCVDLYRQYVKEVLGYPQSPGLVGAADIWTSYLKDYYEKIPNTPTGVPLAGDIVIWNRNYGPYGHVAIVISATINSMTCFSQNDPTGKPCIKKEYTYKNIYGWLHPKEQTMSSELDACLADRLKFWKERDEARAEIEALNTRASGLQARATDLGNQLGKLQAEILNKEEQTGRLKELLLTATNEVESLRIALKDKQNEVDRFAQDKGTLQIEVEQLKTQLATAKQGEVTITIREFIQLLLNQSIKVKKG